MDDRKGASFRRKMHEEWLEEHGYDEYKQLVFNRLFIGIESYKEQEVAHRIREYLKKYDITIPFIEGFFDKMTPIANIGNAIGSYHCLHGHLENYKRRVQVFIEKALRGRYKDLDVFYIIEHMSRMVERGSKHDDLVQFLLETFRTYGENPFVLTIPDPAYKKKLLSGGDSEVLFSILFKYVKATLEDTNHNHPRFILTYLMEQNVMHNIRTAILSIGYYEKNRDILKVLQSAPLREWMTDWLERTVYSEFQKIGREGDAYDVAQMLRFVALNTKLRSFLSPKNGWKSAWKNFHKIINTAFFKDLKCTKRFVAGSFKCDKIEDCIVRIDCSNLSILRGNIEPMLVDLSRIFKRRYTLWLDSLGAKRTKLKQKYPTGKCKYVFELTNINDNEPEILEKIREIEDMLFDKYKLNIEVRACFTEEVGMSKWGIPKSEYVRVISDVHADINSNHKYALAPTNDFVINCGDTSGDCATTSKWIRTHMLEGVVVPGNHLGYSDWVDNGDPEENMKKFGNYRSNKNAYTSQLHYLEVEVDSNSQGLVKVLSNMSHEYNGVLFFGGMLGTNFCLFGEDQQAACMVEALAKMNDFKCKHVVVRSDGGTETRAKVRLCSPEDYLRELMMFKNNGREYMNKYLKENPDGTIVLISHFAPLPYSVAPQYANDPLTAAFATDIRELIDDFPQIRLICHGHTHVKFDYIYKHCRVVCSPFGYFNENDMDLDDYGTRIKWTDLKSKTPWTELLKSEIQQGIIKVYS